MDKELWFIYIYIMEYYSAMKRNTFESVLMKWMNLEPIIQSEQTFEHRRGRKGWDDLRQ